MKAAFTIPCALVLVLAPAWADEQAKKFDLSMAVADADGKGRTWMINDAECDAVARLAPNREYGKQVFEVCAACHLPEGWGRTDGTFPELAGQHRTVLIKELIDIGTGVRGNPAIHPFALASEIGGPQSIADVAGYISSLPMDPENGVGPGANLALGKELFDENCARCHGPNGEGDAAKFYPRIQGQHYAYLLRQYRWIKQGRRRNGNPEMIARIEKLSDQEAITVLDYVSSLRPAKELLAPKGWRNPDFN